MRSWLVIVGLAVGGCETQGGGDSGTTPGAFPFRPANLDLSDVDWSTLGDVVVTGSNQILTTDDPLQTDALNQDDFQYLVVAQDDGSEIGVFAVHSLVIDANTELVVQGTSRFALVAETTLTVRGGLSVPPGEAGGGLQPDAYGAGRGPGGGPGGTETGAIVAGSGGSFCGVGGRGGAGSGASGPNDPGPAAYGDESLVPLDAGSSGGTGATGYGGPGGGAIELVAGDAIEVADGGWVTVPGGGGLYGGLVPNQVAGGGGSGGALLLQSRSITVAGALAANGGGGGQGYGGDPGEDGRTDDRPASGGDLASLAGEDGGGDGGAGAAPDGADGLDDTDHNPGGGGGGAGRIRLDTPSDAPAAVTGTISGCTDYGTLR